MVKDRLEHHCIDRVKAGGAESRSDRYFILGDRERSVSKQTRPALILFRRSLRGNSQEAGQSACESFPDDRLVGLVVRRPPRERKIPGSNPACTGIFFGVEPSHISDLKIGTPVATLPGAWRYRVSDGTGRPGVSIL